MITAIRYVFDQLSSLFSHSSATALALSDTNLGVLIGGLIGIVPTLATIIINLLNQRRQFRHELQMKEIDLIETPRLTALREYCRCIGVFLSDSSVNSNDESNYLSAHASAAAFVSDETLRAMVAAQPIIMSGWYGDSSGLSTKEKLDSPEIVLLLQLIRSEMYISSKYLKAPTRCSNQVNLKEYLDDKKRCLASRLARK